jgi:hypothetical protein
MAHWYWNSGKYHPELLAIIPAERIFFRDEVADDRTMSVPNIRLTPLSSEKRIEVVTVSKIGLYEIGQPLLEWAD